MNIQSAIELITSVTNMKAANFTELKKIYKRASLICHPDRNIENAENISMKDLNNAWDFLEKNEEQVNRKLNGKTPTEVKNTSLSDNNLYDSHLPSFHCQKTLLCQAFNIIEEKEWNSWVEFKYKTVYFSQYSIRIHTFSNCVKITDLTNALDTRKKCTVYNITWDTFNAHEGYCNFLQWISEMSKKSCVSALLAHLTILNFSRESEDVEKAELCPGIKVSRYDLKSGQVFSPFKLHKIQPLLSLPEKMRANHLIKVLANGQYKKLVQSEYLTDDFSYDAANNFGRKVFENPFPLLVDLIENRSGGFYLFPRNDGLFRFGNHMNDTKSIVIQIDNRFSAVDLISSNTNSLHLQ